MREMQSPAPGRNNPIHWEPQAAKQLGRKGPGDAGGHHVEHEPAMCPCCKEGEQFPGLH